MTHGMVSKLQWPAWPAINSATITPSSMALWASIGPRTTSPTAHAGQVGLAVVVHLDEATAIDLEADRFGVEAGGVGMPADRDDQAVELGLLGAVLGFVFDGDGVLAGGDRADLDRQLDVGPCFENSEGFLGQILVGGSRKLSIASQDGDLGTQTAPHRTHLEADHAGADQAEASQHGVDVEGADVVADQLVVHRNARQVAGRRTRRHDDLRLAVTTSYRP